ncbi:MAG: histidine--tRNA ligase, partial [Gammaproteobacteria bacterium]
MSQSLQAIRGMNDILPADRADWSALEQELVGILDAYGFREIRLPIVE